MISKRDGLRLGVVIGVIFLICITAFIIHKSPEHSSSSSSFESSSSGRSDEPFELEAPSRSFSFTASRSSSNLYLAPSELSYGSEFTYVDSDRNSSPRATENTNESTTSRPVGLLRDLELGQDDFVRRTLEIHNIRAPTTTQVAETMARLSAKPNVKATMVLDRAANTILQTSGSFVSFRPVDAPRDGSSEDGVEEFAAMISKFVHTSGGLVQDLDTEDDVKLLRLRTKKHELVIVPDAKYIFVVVHDTPPA